MSSKGKPTIANSGSVKTATPIASAKTADNSDHQNPGARRITNVVINPVAPPIKNSQPKAAIPTANGIKTATNPSMTRMIPSPSLEQPMMSSEVCSRGAHTVESPSRHGHC